MTEQDQIEDISARLDSVIKYISIAHKEIAAGNVVYLDDLQTNVANICSEIGNFHPEQIVQLIEKLSLLSEKMNDFEVDLRAKKLEVEREIKRAGNNKNAATAYEKTKISANKHNKEN